MCIIAALQYPVLFYILFFYCWTVNKNVNKNKMKILAERSMQYMCFKSLSIFDENLLLPYWVFFGLSLLQYFYN